MVRRFGVSWRTFWLLWDCISINLMMLDGFSQSLPLLLSLLPVIQRHIVIVLKHRCRRVSKLNLAVLVTNDNLGGV